MAPSPSVSDTREEISYLLPQGLSALVGSTNFLNSICGFLVYLLCTVHLPPGELTKSPSCLDLLFGLDSLEVGDGYIFTG